MQENLGSKTPLTGPCFQTQDWTQAKNVDLLSFWQENNATLEPFHVFHIFVLSVTSSSPIFCSPPIHRLILDSSLVFDPNVIHP